MATCAAGVDKPCGYEKELSTPVESAFSTSRVCTWPNRMPERSLKARYATTQSATPVATATAACCTVAHAAPPPWWIFEKNFKSPMPVALATATSVLESIVNVTMPSTSAGVSPASSSASSTASEASRSSLRPEFFEKSVAPMPTIAAFPDSSLLMPRLPLAPVLARSSLRSSLALAFGAASGTPEGQRRGRDDVIAKTVAANDFQRDQTVLDRSHFTLE